MRTIGVVTVARSDYGYLLPLLRRIQQDSDLILHIIAAGMHLSPWFGLTVEAIEQDGFQIDDRIEMLLSSDTPESIAKSMGLGTIGFAQSFARFRPDILLVLGDRFEIHAAVSASVPFNIPVAHIAGGESTEGAIDEVLRHSITKMSHLHFVATDAYANRVIQMGEEPWRVVVSGAPSLDNFREMKLLSREKIEKEFGLDLQPPFLLVTYHPVTLEYERTEGQLGELLAALEEVDAGIVFTPPNADTGNHTITHMISEFADSHQRAQGPVNLGTQGYFSAMKYAAAMIGNSSSGIIEAASVKLPVVNIGSRQRGRHHGMNVIDVGGNRQDILKGINQAVSSEFRASLADLTNPYGEGHAAERIVSGLKRVKLDDELIRKRFHQVL